MLETIIICGKCKREVDGDVICPNCGNDLYDDSIELCKNCRVPIKYWYGWAYCPACFAKEYRLLDFE